MLNHGFQPGIRSRCRSLVQPTRRVCAAMAQLCGADTADSIHGCARSRPIRYRIWRFGDPNPAAHHQHCWSATLDRGRWPREGGAVLLVGQPAAVAELAQQASTRATSAIPGSRRCRRTRCACPPRWFHLVATLAWMPSRPLALVASAISRQRSSTREGASWSGHFPIHRPYARMVDGLTCTAMALRRCWRAAGLALMGCPRAAGPGSPRTLWRHPPGAAFWRRR